MKIKHFLILLLLGALCACDKSDDVIVGSDEIATEQRQLTPFHSIEILLPVEAKIIQGPESTLTLKGNKNIVDLINSDIVEGTLVLTLEKNSYQNLTMELVIETSSLWELSKEGLGATMVEGFVNQEDLTIQFNGPDKMTFQNSSAKRLDLHQSEIGSFEGFGLISEDCNIAKDGIGDTEVHCIESLSGTLKGLGNIYYKGTPAVDVEDTGIGDVINSN